MEVLAPKPGKGARPFALASEVRTISLRAPAHLVLAIAQPPACLPYSTSPTTHGRLLHHPLPSIARLPFSLSWLQTRASADDTTPSRTRSQAATMTSLICLVSTALPGPSAPLLNGDPPVAELPPSPPSLPRSRLMRAIANGSEASSVSLTTNPTQKKRTRMPTSKPLGRRRPPSGSVQKRHVLRGDRHQASPRPVVLGLSVRH